jgi:glucose-6-phosphate 1-dehydrogenase
VTRAGGRPDRDGTVEDVGPEAPSTPSKSTDRVPAGGATAATTVTSTAPAVPGAPGAATKAAGTTTDEPPPRPARTIDDAQTMREARLARTTRRRPTARPLENPLREGLRLERMPDPAAFVLFGATGDLAHRKVVPALLQLWRTHLLPREFCILACGRRPYDDETFRTELRDSLRRYSRVPVEGDILEEFLAQVMYHQGDFGDEGTYQRLEARLAEVERREGTDGNALFYLATQPSAFAPIIGQIGRAGLDHEVHGGGWRRIVIEKPFGRDLDSAIRLNREVGKVFRESQVYRIDHYLGKETVRNLLVFRFGNGIFEPIWNRRYVDHVQITVAESIGVEGRGRFYEETGAARDVLQNHLLQLLSLVAMEPPTAFSADELRDEKVKVTRAIAPLGPMDVARDVIRGQYGAGWVAAEPVPGYRQEPEVDKVSETETYVAARFQVDDWRWSGVPFYVRTGKRMPKRTSEIAIQFKAVPHRLFKESSLDPEPNLLAMRIQPDEGIVLRFGAKVPGLGIDVRTVNMDFTYGSSFSVDSPDAYETLILDALLGDASLFTRADEVEAAWAVVTPILDAWLEQPSPDFPNYDAGAWGPAAAEALLARDGRRWRRI